MGVKFGMEEGINPLLLAKFHPHRCNVPPLWGEKPQNRPLSKLNTGRLALRAMLPVTMDEIFYKTTDSPPRQLETISRGRADHCSSNIFVLRGCDLEL